jgi:Tfp pilus assembly protein PilE
MSRLGALGMSPSAQFAKGNEYIVRCLKIAVTNKPDCPVLRKINMKSSPAFMNRYRAYICPHQKERGQTILLVAVAIVSILAMAALAIDVVTLYVARTEMQRAADGAALAGARAFVDSGVTTDPTNTARQTLATDMATALINATTQQNKVGGVQPVLVGTPTPDFTRNGNPQITVTLQRTDLPTFFARIWGRRAMTISASATAEAYNAASSQTSTGSYVPITPKCVKPLLIANKDPSPGGSGPIVNVITGQNVAPNLVGAGPFTLTDACPTGAPAQVCFNSLPAARHYVPASVAANPGTLCPACQGGSQLENSIECCDSRTYTCGGTTTTDTTIDTLILKGAVQNAVDDGIKCLIGHPGQDGIIADDLKAGTGPARITAGSGPLSGQLVTTSKSVATFPIIDTDATAPTPPTVKVVGFLQLFISDTGGAPGSFTATVLNVIGCGNNTSGGAAIFRNSTSPIPVRLIH